MELTTYQDLLYGPTQQVYSLWSCLQKDFWQSNKIFSLY